MPLSTHRHHVRHNPKSAQICQGVLRWFGFVLLARLEKWHIDHMHEQTIFPPNFERKLPNRLNETQPFIIPHRTTDFYEMYIARRRFVDSHFDSVCQMRH